MACPNIRDKGQPQILRGGGCGVGQSRSQSSGAFFLSAAPMGARLCPPSAKNVRFRGAEMMEKRL